MLTEHTMTQGLPASRLRDFNPNTYYDPELTAQPSALATCVLRMIFSLRGTSNVSLQDVRYQVPGEPVRFFAAVQRLLVELYA